MFPNVRVTITTAFKTSKGKFANHGLSVIHPLSELRPAATLNQGEACYEITRNTENTATVLSELQNAKERMAG